MDLPQNNWKKALLSLSSTIEDAIKNLNASSLRIVLVVDKRNKLQGTISDGDIRSGLLRGLDLKSSIKEVINRDSITAPAEIDRNLILQLMTINKVHQIPVVNNDQIVQGLFVWDEITTPNEQNNTFVIMAGGLGTRLRPYTEECPKPLIEIAGKPMLQHIIERAKSEGFYNFCITLNYLGEMIEDYFKVLNLSTNIMELRYLLLEPMKVIKIENNRLFFKTNYIMNATVVDDIEMKLLNVSNQNVLFFK